MKTHKDLDVWNLSVDFVTSAYEITRSFPDEEKFGLVSQIRRASVSIPSNIAEGSARESIKENLRFLNIAMSSAQEVDTQLIIANNLGFLNNELHTTLTSELNTVSKLLMGLIKYQKNRL